MEKLVQTWEINARLNAFLIAAISDEGLGTKGENSKRVLDHFVHIHNVRLMWLKASAPDLLEGTEKQDPTCTREELLGALETSAARISELLRRSAETGRIKGFKPHATAFVGYLISHETFHRAQVELTLRQAKMPISDKVAFGLWEWGVR